MTAGRAVLWDQTSAPTIEEDEVLRWQSYSETSSETSVPRYLERHAVRLRRKYLEFIHELGEYRIAGKRVVDHLNVGDGLSLWWMTQLAEKSPLKSPRIYDCLRLLALEEILVVKRISDLNLVSGDAQLADAVRRLALNLRISFRWRHQSDHERKSPARKLYEALPHAVRGLLSLRHIARRWTLRRSEKPRWFSGGDAVFICSYFIHLDPGLCAQGVFRSRQWEELPGALNLEGKRVNWMQLFLFSTVVPDAATGVNWLRRFNRDACNQGAHAFLESYISPSLMWRVLRTWLWLNIVYWRLRTIQSACNPRQSAVCLWPVIRDDWKSSVIGRTAVVNCLWIALFDSAMRDLPRQRTGLYLCENQPWERALLHAWRKYGHGEIIAVQHATVPFWHLYYFDDPRCMDRRPNCPMPLPDRLAANGPIAMQAFIDSGYPAERLVEVEALRYMGMQSSGESAAPREPAVGRPVEVLILGDLMPASTHHLLRLVEQATKVLRNKPRFTLKSHPGLSVNLTHYPGITASETREALGTILGGYDVAVAANTTSASVDAYLAGLDVIIALDGGGLNLSPFRGLPAVRFVTTGKELAEALDMAAQPGTRDRERQDFFFLDSGLPRWKRLLGFAERT